MAKSKAEEKYPTFTPEDRKALEKINAVYDVLEQDNDHETVHRFVMMLLFCFFITDYVTDDYEKLFSDVREATGQEMIPTPEMPVVTDKANKEINELREIYDWQNMNPFVYATAYESHINAKEKREWGMDYTSRENIHKVTDPLFLYDLEKETNEIIQRRDVEAARAMQRKLAELKFLDPACGSGNFLLETYMCLRQLENRLIELIASEQKNSEFMEMCLNLIGEGER